MRAIRRFLRRLRLSATRRGDEARLQEEVRAHLDRQADENRRAGMAPAEARRQAVLAFGHVEALKDQYRDEQRLPLVDNFARDVRYALRQLRRSPVFAATAILSLAMGIGANAAVFSVFDWVLLRPLPYPASHELVHVFTAGTAPVTAPGGLNEEQFQAFRGATAFRETAVFTPTTRVLAGSGIEPIHVTVARVGGDLFATLGVQPDVGRPFSQEELAAGLPVVVLGHELWRRSLSQVPLVIGRTVSIDGVPHTVIGVMPPHRGYPREAQLWRPLTPAERTSNDGDFSMVARLRSDSSAARATMEIATMAQALSKGARTAWADDLQRTDVLNLRASLQALFAAAMLTLIVACANVAALMGARVADRAGEMAVRSALGATRGRIFAQLIVESLLLALTGGALGMLVGHSALSVLVAVAPVSVPRLSEISLDARIVGLGYLLTLLTGLGVGLAPALRLSRLSRTSTLNRLAWHRPTSRPHARRALVLAQIAVAIVLTTGTGLLLRSLHHLVTQDHGFAPDRLVAVRVYPAQSFGGNVQQLFREMATESERLPGVESVAWSMRLPTQVSGVRASLEAAGGIDFAADSVWRPVSSTYFDTVGTPVTAGRQFDNTDTRESTPVAIVNTALMRRFDGRSPLGVRLTTSLTKQPVTVVGVVADVTPAGEPDRPALYVPVGQSSIGAGYLLVRTRGDAQSMIPALTGRLREVAPGLAFDRIERVAQTLEESRAATRFLTQAAAASAALALLLSMIGVYGLTAGDVSARQREVVIRLALGASRPNVLWTVVRPCAAVLGAGTALGLLMSVSVGPTMAFLLHGVSPTDVPTLVIAPVLLIGVGMLAAGIAAGRVLRTNSSAALHSD